jgi:heterodisulfide reductase subunit A
LCHPNIFKEELVMKGSVLVVGAGISGMRATSELVRQGFKVYLLEEKPTIGGKMALMDKMFPTNECATCTILPQMLELTSNPHVTVLAFTDLLSVEGNVGDFKIKAVKKPRYVDPMKCTACTDCFPACPVGGVPMEFNFGRGKSKAISFYSPFPPRKALINPDKCAYLVNGKCGDGPVTPCAAACKPGAIDFSQKPQEVNFQVGAIILATGMDEAKGEAVKRVGYGRLPNVLTALEYERLLSGLGPTSGVVKRDDGKEPQSVAWLVLDDPSPISFMSAAAEALGTLERTASASVSILYKNLANLGNLYNQFYDESKKRGVRYIQTDAVEVNQGGDGNVVLGYISDGKKESLETEMFVLATPLMPAPGVSEVARKLNLEVDERGLFKKRPGDSHPLHTSREGVLICGGVQGPNGISASVIQACAAAADVAALLAPARDTELVAPPRKQLLPVEPGDEPRIAAVICRCGANIAGLLDRDQLVEYTSSLPHVKKVEVTPFGCDGVKMRELLKTGEFNRVVIGACSPKTHEALFQQLTEAGGLNRYLLEIVNLRNQCTWVHSKNKEEATRKAKTLMNMGVSRVALQVPLEDIHIPVTQSCLVIGGTPSGIGCAAKLSEMGFQVHLVADSPMDKDNAVAGALLTESRVSGKIKTYPDAKIGQGSGFIGSYHVEIVEPTGKKGVDVGSIVIATGARLQADGSDYEKDLALQRDEAGLFVGALGIMNPLDFNTEGIFRCGSARATVDVPEGVVDGEAAASRVAGIISKNEIVKAPTLSTVIDENCDGCAYCVEPCPARAITLLEYMYDGSIKKTVEVNEAMCRGCGICMATCPKDGIFVRHFKPEYFRAMIKAALGVS